MSGRRTVEGQGLVEFALTFPIFMLVLMGLIEFGFLYNNILTVQFASRQGSSVAAQVGADDGGDCTILKAVEAALTAPIDRSRIVAVEIFQSDTSGDPLPGRITRYARNGSMECSATTTQPYTMSGFEGYPEEERREALADTLDIVGVRIEYSYAGITPIGSGRTWTVSDGATLRMEPKR
jgi:Flp pilus assembly protein TadG